MTQTAPSNMQRLRKTHPERYESIIRSALRTFAEHGFDRARIDSIALNAGIGKGTIYNYVSDKEDLYAGTVRFIVQDHAAYVKNAVFPQNSFEEKVRYFFESDREYFSGREESRKVLAAAVGERAAGFRDMLTDTLSDFDSLIDHIVDAGVLEHKVAKKDKVDVRDLIAGLHTGYILNAHSGPREAGKAAELLFRGVASGRKKPILAPYMISRASGGEKSYFQAISAFADDFESCVNDAFPEYFPGYEEYRDCLSARKGAELILHTSKTEYCLDMLTVEVMNRSWREFFVNTDRKIVVLPMCLNAAKYRCESEYIEEIGLHYCASCAKKCAVQAITQAWHGKNGIEVYTTVSMTSGQPDQEFEVVFEKLMKKNASAGVLGVACLVELVLGMKKAIDAGIPAQGVPLSYNSCARWTGGELITTDVHLEKINEILTF
ncbi:DUF116 domain-containing protein [candidate division KSB1 bacterium]